MAVFDEYLVEELMAVGAGTELDGEALGLDQLLARSPSVCRLALVVIAAIDAGSACFAT